MTYVKDLTDGSKAQELVDTLYTVYVYIYISEFYHAYQHSKTLSRIRFVV